MVLGDWTVPKRLFQFKAAIRKNDNGKYSSMLTGDGTINNSFLNYLVPTVATDLTDTDSITLLNNSMSNSANFENRLIAYFSDLLQSDNEAVRSSQRDWLNMHSTLLTIIRVQIPLLI